MTDPDDELLDLASKVAGWAVPGEQIEVYLTRSRTSEVKAFGGDIESVSSADSEGVGVRVINAGRQGFSYSASLDEVALKAVLDDARDNTPFGTPDEFAGLPRPDGVRAADLTLYHPELSRMPMSDKVALALDLEQAVRLADTRVRGVESAVYGDSEAETAIASSEGVRALSRKTRCWLVADAIAGEGGDTQTGYGFSIGRKLEDLDLATAASDAAFRATRLLGATKPESRRLTVVFEPRVTASLLGIISGTLNAESVLKKRSVFADRMGETIGSPLVTIVDDPTEARAAGAGAYDAEGLASRRNLLVDGGVLIGLLHDSYTGRRTGGASNGCAVRGGFKTTPGPGSRALALTPGSEPPEALLDAVGSGLLVTSANGLHSGANPVSGDISVGIEGLMIRNGSPAEPVREATVATSLPALLAGIVAIGSDLDWGLGGAAGVTVVVEGVTLSGS